MPRYDFFGDTVNTASRMESTSEGGCLQISPVTKALLSRSGIDFAIEKRECMTDGRQGIAIKGKGIMQTYWVRGIKDEASPDRKASDPTSEAEGVESPIRDSEIRQVEGVGNTVGECDIRQVPLEMSLPSNVPKTERQD
mmetsp:Transcript_4128/g.6549  ORF Transcript_4128/g.6549 Transcript_4128/m.6549 type:complete len:139 (-) Transcript_4128:74-490(-)